MSLSTNAFIAKGHDSGPRTERPLTTDLLKCPKCESDFSPKRDLLVCTQGHSFPYRKNVIDFSSVEEIDHIQRRSEQSFGVEWTQYYATLGWAPKDLASEKEMFLTYTRAMPNFFSNQIVIDAGCGNGRYVNVINNISSPPPRLIIGIDLSDSIFVAAKNCSIFDNVLFVKFVTQNPKRDCRLYLQHRSSSPYTECKRVLRQFGEMRQAQWVFIFISLWEG